MDGWQQQRDVVAAEYSPFTYASIFYGGRLNPSLISRTAKERFILKMSEDEFRDRLVRPVLLMRGFKDGRDLCGPTEQGKDALFYGYDLLENLELTAIQTKKGSVNLASKASQNLVDIAAQLRTAAGTTYALLKPIRAKVKATRTCLVVSGKINESARKHLVDEIKDTSLQFLDVDDLIPWVDEVMPQLWLDIDANVSAYYIALEKQLLGGDGQFAKQFLQTGTSVHESCFGEEAISVYVRQARDNYKETPKHGKRGTADTTFPLHALTNKTFRKILVVGDWGAGKTTGLLQIVYKAARDGLEKGTQSQIPVLIKASDIAEVSPVDLCAYLVDHLLQLTPIKKPVFGLSDLTAGHVQLFVDAIDEIAKPGHRELVVSLINKFAESYPKCQVIVTSRPYEFLAELTGLSDFERFNVVPIGWKDAERILDLVKAKQAVSTEKVKESLQQLSRVQGFTLNPLMVSVYASTSNFEAKDVPPNVTELFKRFTEQMLGRWDEQKGLQHLHRPLLKDFVLCALAFHMHDSKTTKISRQLAESIIKTRLDETGHIENEKSILEEIIDRSGLFRDYGEEIGFRHHMFQEFFAGRAIPTAQFMVAKSSDIWWRRAIVFYFGDRPGSAGDLLDAIKNIGESSPKDRYSTLCTIGLALQACYLSKVTDKTEIWKAVVSGLADTHDAYLAAHDPTNQTPIITNVTHRLQTRDAIALSNIADQDQVLRNWIESVGEKNSALHAFHILALMRIGRFDLITHSEAKEFVKSMDNRLMILVEAIDAIRYRPLGAAQKKFAKELEEIAATGSKGLYGTVMKEVDIQLQRARLVQQKLAQLTSPKAKDSAE